MHLLAALLVVSLSKPLPFLEEKPGSEAGRPLLGENKADAVGCPFLSFLIRVVSTFLQASIIPKGTGKKGACPPARKRPRTDEFNVSPDKLQWPQTVPSKVFPVWPGVPEAQSRGVI